MKIRKLDPRITLETEYGTFTSNASRTFEWKTTWQVKVKEHEAAGITWSHGPREGQRRARQNARKALRHFKQAGMA